MILQIAVYLVLFFLPFNMLDEYWLNRSHYKNPEDKFQWTIFTIIKILDLFPGHKRSQQQILAAWILV